MKHTVTLIGGGQATVELKDREAVRRLFMNHGFWDGDTFYAAAAIHSIAPYVGVEGVGAEQDAPVTEDRSEED